MKSLAPILLLAGCGYTFAARAPLPAGVRSIEVQVFENLSAEPQAGAIVAQAAAEEIARQKRAERGADAILHGTVHQVTATPLAPDRQGAVQSWRLRVVASFRVVAEGRVLYEEPSLARVEEYLAGGDVLATESARRLALVRAARALAQDVLERMAARSY